MGHPKDRSFYTHSAVAGSFPAPTSPPSPSPPSSLTTCPPFHHRCCPVEAQRHHEEKCPEKCCTPAPGTAQGPLQLPSPGMLARSPSMGGWWQQILAHLGACRTPEIKGKFCMVSVPLELTFLWRQVGFSCKDSRQLPLSHESPISSPWVSRGNAQELIWTLRKQWHVFQSVFIFPQQI